MLRDVNTGGTWSVTTRRVVLSAGSLGTTEILLRNRDVHGPLAAAEEEATSSCLYL